MTEYEDKFVEIFKEADLLHGLKAEKMPEEEWKKRCAKLFEAVKKNQEDIDKDIKKLSEEKRLFWKIELHKSFYLARDCEMVTYYIKEDCLAHPETCPIGVKELMKKEIQSEQRDHKLMLEWAEKEKKPENIEFYKEKIKEDEEKIKRLS